MRYAILFIAAVILCNGSALAQTPEEIQKLVDKLSSSKYAERAAASKALEDLGEKALVALRKAVESGDLEQKQRAQQLVERIESKMATAKLLSGKKIRLVYKDVLVLDAVDDLAAKIGFKIVVEGDRLPLRDIKVTLDTGEVTFWEAYTKLCEAAGLTERSEQPPKTFGPTPSYIPSYRLPLKVGKSQASATAFAGPVRVQSVPASKKSGQALFTLEVSPEPKLPWLGLRSLRLTKVIDESGQLLPLPEPYLSTRRDPNEDGAPRAIPGTTFETDRVPVSLQLPQPSKLLKEVHGTIAAEVETNRQLLLVKNFMQAKGKAFRLGDVDKGLTILSTTQNGDHVSIKVKIDGPLAIAMAQEQTPDLGGLLHFRAASFKVLDAKSQPWKLVGQNVIFMDDNGQLAVELLMTFQPIVKDQEPSQFVVNGLATVTLEIPFVLRDVKLP